MTTKKSKTTKKDDTKVNTDEDNLFDGIFETAMPILKNILSTEDTKQNVQTDKCEVHIIGSEKMILKMFGLE